MGPERLVQIKKWNSQNKIFVPSKSGPEKYPWKSAKVARKLRERRAKAEVPTNSRLINEFSFLFTKWSIYSCVWVPELVHEGEQGQTTSVFTRSAAKTRENYIQVTKRWGKLMAKDHVIRMECARLSFTATWWCIVIRFFSRYSPRKLAKATLLWLLLAKAKTQVAKGSRKIIAKDRVILTKSERVFYTAHVLSGIMSLYTPLPYVVYMHIYIYDLYINVCVCINVLSRELTDSALEKGTSSWKVPAGGGYATSLDLFQNITHVTE